METSRDDPESGPPLGIVELLMRVGETNVLIQNLMQSVTDLRSRKRGDVVITFATNQITPADLLCVTDKPWAQMPMTGLVLWMPTPLVQAAIRAHVAAGGADPTPARLVS